MRLEGLSELCGKVIAPSAFILYRINEGGLLEKSGPSPLTRAELSSAWAMEGGTKYTIEILCLLSEDQRKALAEAAPEGHRGARATTPPERAEAVGWMAEEMGISPYFFDRVFRISRITPLALPQLSPSMQRSQTDGGANQAPVLPNPLTDPVIDETSESIPQEYAPETLNGVYPVSTNLAGSPTTVWYSHLLKEDYSLYVINSCTEEKLEELERFMRLQAYSIPLLGIDCVLLDDYRFFNKEFSKIFTDANKSVAKLDAKIPNDTQDKNRNELDRLYKAIYVVYDSYEDTKRTLRLLKRVLEAMSDDRFGKDSEEQRKASDNLLESSEEICRSRESTVSHTLGQLSNMMNFKVAASSAQTAEEAKRDASAITSISLVTMVFLPGSFVAAIFSTQFAEPTGNGVKFSRGAWILAAVTIPVTFAVLLLWTWLHGSVYFKALHDKVSKSWVGMGLEKVKEAIVDKNRNRAPPRGRNFLRGWRGNFVQSEKGGDDVESQTASSNFTDNEKYQDSFRTK